MEVYRLIAGLGAVMVALFAAANDSRAQESAAPPMPAPGRMVDIGGWRLHINCTGTARAGQPTVVLEAGVGAFSVEWSLVQPRIADFARVCTYDRAGSGWSEWGPHPRTFDQIVYELHTLLARAGEAPPFVLVGASYGGWLVRVYQLNYPTEVAGLVLVDGGASDPLRLMPDGRVGRSSDLARRRAVPPVQTSGPLRESDIPAAALAQIRAGLSSASARANEPPRDKLPPDAQRMRSWGLGQVGHVVAAVNPFEPEELDELRRTMIEREYPLGDLPLIVLTRGRSDDVAVDSEDREQEHRKDHALIAAMSRRSRHVIAERSGHHIQIEDPEVVIAAIRDVLRMQH